MLVKLYPKLLENPLIKIIRKCLDSVWAMVLIIGLAAISNVFGLEIPVYYMYTLMIILACLFCDDLLCAFPMSCCSYMTFSKSNNPLSKEQTSIFLEQSAITHMIIIGITIFIFILSRVTFELITDKEKRKVPKLFYGFFALGLAYILGGLFSSSYSLQTAIFGLIQILALGFTYFCFYYTVNWKRVSENYFPLLFTLIGVLMCIEILYMLIDAGLFVTDGAFSRSNLYTGWGHYNNVASAMIFCIPAPFYFACTKKNGWIYSLIGTVFLVFLIFNQSRNGMLMGSIIYAICALLTLIKSTGKERIKNLGLFAFLFLCLVGGFIVFKEKIQDIFASVYKAGTDDSGRIEIYVNGLKQFKESPIFGKGFYECDAYRWGVTYQTGDFLPPRYHNTYVQILACCGIIGILAYLFHRFQTLKMLWKNKNLGNMIIAITLLGFILLSLFDCHFHNFGPGFLYSALLILSEKVYCRGQKKDIKHLS